MEITQVDGAGKICIPPEMAKKLGVQPGSKFQINIKGDILILQKIHEDSESRENTDIQEMMQLSELSLKEFLESEPDLYSDTDLKVKYK